MPKLRNVARSRDVDGGSISVLLRPSALVSNASDKQRDIAEIPGLGIDIVEGDQAKSPVDEPASLFARHDTVIGCTGIAAGIETPMKVAKAALQAQLRHYFPWQFGVDFEVIGRGSPQDIFDSQLDVRELLRAQHETEWVIISTAMFINYVFDADSGMVDLANDTVNGLGSLDTGVTVTQAARRSVLGYAV